MVVLVTRPSPMGEELVQFIQAHGHTAYHYPLIEFSQGRDLMELSQRITQMREEDMIFVVSKTAIDYLASFFKNNPLSWPPSIFYYAIGRNTAQAWQKINPFKIRYPLNQETSEGLLALANLQFINKKTALILRGNGGRELLGDHLKKRGAQIIYCECYQRHPVHYDGAQKSIQWQRLKVDTVVVTSEEMLHRIYALVPEAARFTWLIKSRLIVVSARLANIATHLGWHHIQIAENASNESLLHTVLSI